MDKATMRGGPTGPIASATVIEPEPISLDDLQDHPPEPDPDVMQHLDGSVTVQLKHPLRPHTGKGADIAMGLSKIVLRELYTADIIEMDKGEGDFGKVRAVVKELSQLPDSVLDRLHYLDYAKLHGIVGQKLGNFLVTSAMASSLLPKS
jgi:hypothetical protein